MKEEGREDGNQMSTLPYLTVQLGVHAQTCTHTRLGCVDGAHGSRFVPFSFTFSLSYLSGLLLSMFLCISPFYV